MNQTQHKPYENSRNALVSYNTTQQKFSKFSQGGAGELFKKRGYNLKRGQSLEKGPQGVTQPGFSDFEKPRGSHFVQLMPQSRNHQIANTSQTYTRNIQSAVGHTQSKAMPLKKVQQRRSFIKMNQLFASEQPPAGNITISEESEHIVAPKLKVNAFIQT